MQASRNYGNNATDIMAIFLKYVAKGKSWIVGRNLLFSEKNLSIVINQYMKILMFMLKEFVILDF